VSILGNLAVATSAGFTATREATAQSARHLAHFFQPWHRRALVLIAFLAAFCNFFQLQRITAWQRCHIAVPSPREPMGCASSRLAVIAGPSAI
jgi:hypothetical protein